MTLEGENGVVLSFPAGGRGRIEGKGGEIYPPPMINAFRQKEKIINGETKSVVQEARGRMTTSGYVARMKPPQERTKKQRDS